MQTLEHARKGTTDKSKCTLQKGFGGHTWLDTTLHMSSSHAFAYYCMWSSARPRSSWGMKEQMLLLCRLHCDTRQLKRERLFWEEIYFFFFLQQVTLRTCFFLRCFFKNKNSSLFVEGRDYEQARVQTMKTIGQNPLLDLCETKECQNLLFFTYRICFLVTEKKILLSIHRK